VICDTVCYVCDSACVRYATLYVMCDTLHICMLCDKPYGERSIMSTWLRRSSSWQLPHAGADTAAGKFSSSGMSSGMSSMSSSYSHCGDQRASEQGVRDTRVSKVWPCGAVTLSA
jgi:hypothetical protein